MTMHVRRCTADTLPLKRAPRSITGTTAPRKLITPRMKLGIMGISVRLPYSMISFTFKMPTANISLPTLNVRYWWVSPLCIDLAAPPAPRWDGLDSCIRHSLG